MSTPENALPEGPTPPPTPPRRRGVRLGSVRNVCSELARTYRELKAGSLSANVGRVRVYTLQVLSAALAGIEMEERLARIEQLLGVRTLSDVAVQRQGLRPASESGNPLERAPVGDTSATAVNPK